MNKVITFIRTITWRQFVLIFSISAVAIAYILRSLTPTQLDKQPTVLTNAFNIESDLNNITFSGQAPAIPEQMPSATLLTYTEEPGAIKDKLVAKYALTRSDKQGEIWENDDYILSVLEKPNLIVLSRSGEEVHEDEQTGFTAPVVETIIQNTNKLMQELYPNNTPTLLQNNISYLGDSHEVFEAVSAQEAHQMVIPYSYQINGIPVYLEKELHYTAYFVYDAQQNLISAELRPYQLSIETDRNYKSLTMPMAMSNVNNNQSAIIFTNSLGINGNAPLVTASGEMFGATIEYRADPISNTIAPYYRLSGELLLEDENRLDTEIITPAIQTNFGNTTQ